jgi:MFS transporter, DHA1 family, multidrug resistance protein
VVFALVAVLAALVFGLVAAALPETLASANRTPIAVRATSSAVAQTVRNPVFGCFVLVFGLLASAQLAFGVAGPFLYQEQLGFAPAAYGAIALAVGAANLVGELACGYFAVRLSTRKLALSALALFGAGTAVLVVSGLTIGIDAWALTIGAALALAGCGVLCPQMYGLALGLFTKNLGLVGGIASAGCYLIVSVALAAVGALPENDQATLGWLYVVCGLAAVVLLLWATADRRTANSPVAPVASSPPTGERFDG